MAHHDRRPLPWFSEDRALVRNLARPVQNFLDIEASSGLLLVAATIVALLWANSPWSASYESLFTTEISLQLGSFDLVEDLRHWINDGLMALFFFVVGLEIKREWVSGELKNRRNAALPAVAALGGMVVPALIYLAFNAGGAGERGWGVPMATDIAFALGVVALLGSRVPTPLKVFLLTLAIIDDIGAILVIAVAYTDDLAFTWLGGAAGVVVLVLVMRRFEIRYRPLFVVMGVALWLCVFESGVHATIAGVVMALLTPARPHQDPTATERIVDTLEDRDQLTPTDVRRVAFLTRESVAISDRLEHFLHPWTSNLVVPLFALANAGIALTSEIITSGSPVVFGVTGGLVVGKVVGVAGFAWIGTRLGLGGPPGGASWKQVIGIGALAGIGFTVSLFVAGLAFAPGAIQDEAKVGILAASAIAAALGTAILSSSSHRPAGPSAESASEGSEDEPVAVAAQD